MSSAARRRHPAAGLRLVDSPAAERRGPPGTKGRVLLVTPRPPRRDGHGDQRRAYEILTALAPAWTVEVLSWLPGCERGGLARWADRPGALARAARLSFRLPLQVAYVQGRAPRELARRLAQGGFDRVVFVTDRAVPRRLPDGAVVDLIDDLGGAALRRADASRGLTRRLWRFEGRRLRHLDTSLAERAAVTVAHSRADAADVPGRVGVVPLALGRRPLPEAGARVVFVGNLFYAPNHEAALWVCRELAPALHRAGVDPACLLLAGRRPRSDLREAARVAGVELRADVADMDDVMRQAAVALSPMTLGSGAQYKVLDACAAGRPCVLSPRANAGLDLVDGRSALICERTPVDFARAIALLLANPALRERLAAGALEALAPNAADAVAVAWRSVVERAGNVDPQRPASSISGESRSFGLSSSVPGR